MRRASNIAAVLAITLVVFGLGGVHTYVVGGACLLSLLAAGLKIGHVRARERDVLVSVAGLGLCLAAVLCVAQLVPVPDFVHAVLNPRGLEIYQTGVELAGLAGRWRPLSMDASETGDRAMRYIALTGIAIWAANVRGRRLWRTFAYGLVPLALVDLAIGYALFRTGATSFLGIYEPTVGFRGPSTFISTNHAGVFYGFAALVSAAAALGFRREQPRRAMSFGAATAVLVIAALAQDSDGVLLALGATAGFGVLVQWWRLGRPTEARLDLKIGGGLLVILSVVAAVWLDLHRLALVFLERVALSGEHGGRVELMSAGVAALGDFWRFGAGAGSIETVLPAYVDWSDLIAASIPVIENDTLEVLLSFGAVFGGLILLAFVAQVAAQVRAAVDGRRSPRYAVALVAALYIGVVAQLHFPLFALGIALPVAAWMELLWSRRTRSSSGGPMFTTGHVAISPPVALGGVVLLGLGMLAGAQSHFVWYAPAPELKSESELAREVWLHPGSHVPYVKLGTAALLAGDRERALALAEFAVEREPSPRVRLYHAQVLARVDPDAGVEQFGQLFDEGHTGGRFVARFLDSIGDPARRVDVLSSHPEMWQDAAERIRRDDGPDAASSFVVELATLHPDNVEVYRLASTTYLRLGQPVLAELWAQLVADFERRRQTPDAEAPLLLARAFRASGRVEEARKVLDQAVENPAVVRSAHREALDLRGPPNAEMLSFVERHYDAYCVSPIPPADQPICWGSEAWLLETQGDISAATRVYRRMGRRHGNYLPLAQFFLRNQLCEDLTTLARELEPGPQRRQVESLGKRCR